MSRCSKCSAEIVWIKMESGKSMPCDPELYSYLEERGGAKKFVTPSGKLVSGRQIRAGEMPDGAGYKPHWASCPAAEQFRRR